MDYDPVKLYVFPEPDDDHPAFYWSLQGMMPFVARHNAETGEPEIQWRDETVQGWADSEAQAESDGFAAADEIGVTAVRA
jgi:hypothetical protein